MLTSYFQAQANMQVFKYSNNKLIFPGQENQEVVNFFFCKKKIGDTTHSKQNGEKNVPYSISFLVACYNLNI